MGISFEWSTVPLAGVCSGTTAYPQLVQETTYKPKTQLFLTGFEPAVLVDGLSMQNDALVTLTLKIYTPDSRNPTSEMNLLSFSTYVPRAVEDQDDKYQRYYLRNFLESYEMHECAEWFKINGELVNDPHAKEKSR